MKKGISIWSFAEESLEKCFALAKDAGFDGVELALDEKGLVSLESTKEDLEKVKALAKAAGIELYSVASLLYWEKNYVDNDEKVRKEAIEITKKHLEVAAGLGCQSILVVPGAVSEDIRYDEAYDRCYEALCELAPVAEKFGVELCIENVWNKFLLSPLEMRDLIDKVGSKYVGAYFDVGNILLTGFPDQWIKILGNRIKKVHFKDYKTGVGSLDGFVDILGGDVDYIAVMNAFKEVGYDGWATAEMLPPYKLFPETILYNTSNAMNKILGVK